MPEINENMVTVDHNLSGGVISSLHPENSDAVEGITPSSTKENPYKTTCEEVDDQEVYPKKLPSTIFLETTPTDNLDLPSVNEEELLISTVNHSSLREGVTAQGRHSPSNETSSILEGESSDYDNKEIPWYDRKPSSTKTPPSHESKQAVVVQGWFPQSDENSTTSKEELFDYEPTLWEWQSTMPDDEASGNEEGYLSESDKTWGTALPESEEDSMDSNSTYKIHPTAQEARRKLEATLPNVIRRSLGLSDLPETKPTIIPLTNQGSPTTETTGLRDAIQNLLRKEKLRGHQRK